MQTKLAQRDEGASSTAAERDEARGAEQGTALDDARPDGVAQRRRVETANASPRLDQQRMAAHSVQRKTNDVAVAPNRTGLPDQLKAGIESLSGISMDGVKVHYNSAQPAQLHAHAFAQGTDIHIGPGQERHLPHEAWHVVQQAQGRVRPTLQMKAGAVNDDPSLEREADIMGEKAAQLKSDHYARKLLAEKPTAAVIVQPVTSFVQTGVVTIPADALDHSPHQIAQRHVIKRMSTEAGKCIGVLQRVHEEAASATRTEIVQEGQRSAKLTEMVTALQKEQLRGLPPFDEIRIDYIPNGPEWYGEAKPIREKNQFVINIHPMAFDEGLSVVYSTLRHELIHVAQYKGMEDREAAKISGIAPSSSSAPASSSSSTPAVESDVLYTEDNEAVSEIETHAWEIINAKNSGISLNFLKTRAVALQNLLNTKKVKEQIKKTKFKDLKAKVKEAKEVYESFSNELWPTWNGK